jgi:hypothetical protein
VVNLTDLTIKNPDNELLYIWVKSEIYYEIPSIELIENHEEVIKLSTKFNAAHVFAGI